MLQFWERPKPKPPATVRLGAMSVGALAIGALAVGALAIGFLAIGRLAVGRARIGRSEIDELVVRRVRGLNSGERPIDGA